jgi:hypothetical protein
MAIQLEGSAQGRVATLQSLSSVDETEIPGPAVPVWRDQLKSLLSLVGIPVFERMRLLERDDRLAFQLAYKYKSNAKPPSCHAFLSASKTLTCRSLLL